MTRELRVLECLLVRVALVQVVQVHQEVQAPRGLQQWPTVDHKPTVADHAMAEDSTGRSGLEVAFGLDENSRAHEAPMAHMHIEAVHRHLDES